LVVFLVAGLSSLEGLFSLAAFGVATFFSFSKALSFFSGFLSSLSVILFALSSSFSSESFLTTPANPLPSNFFSSLAGVATVSFVAFEVDVDFSALAGLVVSASSFSFNHFILNQIFLFFGSSKISFVLTICPSFTTSFGFWIDF